MTGALRDAARLFFYINEFTYYPESNNWLILNYLNATYRFSAATTSSRKVRKAA